jgi:hypothetical protein
MSLQFHEWYKIRNSFEFDFEFYASEERLDSSLKLTCITHHWEPAQVCFLSVGNRWLPGQMEF